MALGTPVSAAVAYSASGGTSVSPAYPTGLAAGDVILLVLGQKPSTANGGTVTTPTGWTLIDSLTGAGGYGTTLGADTGNTNLRVYAKDTVIGSETGNLAVTVGANGVCWAFMVHVPSAGGVLSYGFADGSRTTAPTAGSPFAVALTNGASPTDFEAGDVAVWAMCIPSDVTTPSQFSARSVTATGATFGTAVELREPDSQTGNDIGGYSAYASVTAGSSTTAPSVTVTAAGTVTNVRGPVVLVRVREAALPSQDLIQTARVDEVNNFFTATVEKSNTLAPTAYNNAETFYSATVLRGAVTLAPSLYSNTNTFYSATAEQTGGGQSLTPARYNNANTLYGPSVSAIRALTPARYSNTNAFYSATVTTTLTLTAARYNNTNTFYGVSVGRRNTLTPSRFNSSSTFYSPTVATTRSLVAARYNNTSQFFAGTVSTSAVITAPLYSNTASFYHTVITAEGEAQPLEPNLYTNTSGFYSASVLRGAVTIEPDRYSGTNQFYSATAEASKSLASALVTNSSAIYSASVLRGSITLAPSRYDSSGSIYSANVTAQASIAPSRLSNSSTFFPTAVVLTAGPPRTLTPSLYSNPDTFLQPKITLRLAPAPVSNSNAFFAANVTARRTLVAPRINGQNAFYAANVKASYSLLVNDYVDSGYIDGGYVGPILQNSQTFFATRLARVLKPVRFANGQSFYGGSLAVGPVIPPASSIDVDLEVARLRSEADYSVLVADTEYRSLAAKAAYAILNAATSYTLLAGKAAYQFFRAAGELGEFLVFRNFSETASIVSMVFRFLGKGAADTVTATDAAVKAGTKDQQDALNTTDVADKATTKLRTDAASASDGAPKSVGKTYAETSSTSDVAAKDFVRARADSLQTSDTFSRTVQFYRSPAESVTTVDVYAQDITKTKDDSSSVSEVVSKTFARALSDTMLATDDINGAAAGDESVIAVFKIRNDAVNATDTIVRQMVFGRAPSDAASTSDSGSVRSQGYSDFDYFMEDYVGASRTF